MHYGQSEGSIAPGVPASDEWRKTPGKKNTRRWCKGKVGREHTPEVVMQHGIHPTTVCRVPNDWRKQLYPDRPWACYHEVRCSTCGKFLSYVKWQDCPDKPKEIS